MRLAITGTPGVGKSSLADELSLLLGTKVIHLTQYIKRHRLAEAYDSKRESMVIDPKALEKSLRANLPKGGYIVEGHLSQTLPPHFFDACILLRCQTDILRKRLSARRYSPEKIQENLDCELLDVCGHEARVGKHRVLVADSTRATPRALANKVFMALRRFSTASMSPK
ncbi:MAG: adenylate kinase family protein [Nanoarchaeota archaeon]